MIRSSTGNCAEFGDGDIAGEKKFGDSIVGVTGSEISTSIVTGLSSTFFLGLFLMNLFLENLWFFFAVFRKF